MGIGFVGDVFLCVPVNNIKIKVSINPFSTTLNGR